MMKCIVLGNEFEIRRSKRNELKDVFGCEENGVEVIVEENNKLGFIYSDIKCEIGGEEISSSKNPGIYNILGKNDLFAISGEFRVNTKVYEINVFEKSYGEESDIRTIEVELNTECQLDEFDDDFYHIKIKIKECIKNYYKEVYFIEDTQNEYICIELYKMVYSNENKFRSIINKYMIINYGVNWFDKVIDKSYKDSVLNLNRWYRQQGEAEFKDVKSELYNLLIDDLIEMLKESQIDGVLINERNKYKEFLNSLSNISKLKPILEAIDINKENIWDRNFRQYIDEEFEEKWNDYKYMRNMVAHNKLICKPIRNKIIEYSNIISLKLDNLSDRLQRIYNDNEKMQIDEICWEINEEFRLEESGGNKLQSVADVLKEIGYKEEYYNIMDNIEDKLWELSNKSEDFSSQIEEILYYYNNEINSIEKSKLVALYSILEMFGFEEAELKRVCIEEINNQCVLDRFLPGVLGNLRELKERLTKVRYFKEKLFHIGLLIKYTDIYGRKIKMISSGYIYPSRGETDSILLELYIDDIVVKSGTIEKQYFDYIINENEGYAMPEVEEDLWVNINELDNEILSNLTSDIKILDVVTNILEREFIELLE